METTLEEAPTKEQSIVALVEATPVIVLTDKEKFNQFYRAMREETDALDADTSTEKGRKAIASMAYKVARTKTAIDDAGKKLNEEARAQINAVDESRREIRQQLDQLKDEVRRPLTEWEEAEKQREADAAQQLAFIRESARVDIEATSTDVINRLNALASLTVDPDLHRAGTDIATSALASTIATLEDARDRLKREEAERAELERLRAESAERERQEAERQTKEAEEKRIAEAEKAETERLERLAREAEERAKAEAEREAKEQREAAERAHAEELAAERARAEAAEREAQAERERQAKEEADRKAEADRIAAEQRAREADRAHRSKVMSAAKEAVMEAGPVEESVAKSIILAIAAGNVPSVSIAF